MRGLLVTVKGVSTLFKLVNETITSKAYQDNIKSILNSNINALWPNHSTR